MPPPVNGGYGKARMPACSAYLRKGTILVQAINLADKLSKFSEHWQPRVVGQFNGHDLMVVKVKGEFVWHKHDDTDDFSLVFVDILTFSWGRGGAMWAGAG